MSVDISCIVNIRSNLTHLHGVQLLVLLPWSVELFGLQQQNKSESKVKFRQTSNCCKRVLETAKIGYGNKTKEPITSQKLALKTFGKLLILFSTKLNLLTSSIERPRDVVSSASDKAKLFSKIFSKNSNKS